MWSGSFFTVDVFEAVFGFRKRVLFRKLNRFVNFLVDTLLQLVKAGLGDQSAVHEKAFEAVNRIAFLPEFEEFRRHVSGVVMSRMPRHSARLAFDQRRAMPGSRSLDRPSRCIPDGEDVIAIHDLSWQAIGFGAISDILNGHLTFQRRRISILVIVADEDDGRFEDRRHVDAFVPIAAARCAVAEETESHAILPAHLEGQADSRRNRNVVAEHTDEGDQILGQIAHVHVAVFAPRRAGLSRHVLRENRTQRHAPNEKRAHVAMGRTDDVILPQINAAADGDGLLTATDIYAANDLALAVELPLNPEFQFPRQLHVIKHGEKSFLGWQSYRWYRVPRQRVCLH